MKNRALISRIAVSKDLRKYFRAQHFFTTYDVDIQNVDESILQIPAVAGVIPIAWAVGADIHVKSLDRTFLNSLDQIKDTMRHYYPNFSYATEIHVEKIVTNNLPHHAYGLLYSGGLDSTVSYIRHKDKKPNLITFRGIDFPFRRTAFWKQIKNEHTKFAAHEQLELNFIETNHRNFLNEFCLDMTFGKYLPWIWYGDIQFGISMAGFCAPFTSVKSIGTLFFASAITPNCKQVKAPFVFTNKNAIWGNTRVIHDGFALTRQEKIADVLEPYVSETHNYPHLRVCDIQFHTLNCNNCEKCWRTSAGLVLANLDPNNFGLRINSRFFDFLKERLRKNRARLFSQSIHLDMWQDIQTNIPKQLDHNLYNSKKFFNWFRSFDLTLEPSQTVFKVTRLLWQFFYKLPKPLQVWIGKPIQLFRKNNIMTSII